MRALDDLLFGFIITAGYAALIQYLGLAMPPQPSRNSLGLFCLQFVIAYFSDDIARVYLHIGTTQAIDRGLERRLWDFQLVLCMVTNVASAFTQLCAICGTDGVWTGYTDDNAILLWCTMTLELVWNIGLIAYVVDTRPVHVAPRVSVSSSSPIETPISTPTSSPIVAPLEPQEGGTAANEQVDGFVAV
ncbi:hypothetical protein FFLO_02658 [Filobasidium floriforme]|uniref:Uncharacterized protein n=1 Tax=Filobasidium floriforme TaxID=5210 RepID=A0A8K0JMA2_9TREE|nr:uncharacterized protein HD553DRAFT_359925 [Filobasidium floriforme]KAG7561929.1 hypothetical protein FFLO_02658 [Filobasidium floriforme]KAH8089410.1 hypothetical protein HD553DRAFT_359925 [Filobasidium floriforme]